MKTYLDMKWLVLGVLLFANFSHADNGVGSHGKQQQQQQQQAACDDDIRDAVRSAEDTFDKCEVEYDPKVFAKIIKRARSNSAIYAHPIYSSRVKHALKEIESLYEADWLLNSATQECHDQELKDLQNLKDAVTRDLKFCSLTGSLNIFSFFR